MTAPVLLVFFSRTRMPASGQLADDLATLATEFDGRFLAGLVDIDAAPGIAQAMQIPERAAGGGGPGGPADAVAAGRGAARGAARRADPGDAAADGPGGHRAAPAPAGGSAGGRGGRASGRPAVRRGAGRAGRGGHRPRDRRVPEAGRCQPRRCRGRGRAGDGPGAPAHRRGGRERRPGPRRPSVPTTWTRRPWWPTSTCSAGTWTTPSPGWSTVVRRTVGDDRDRARQHLLGLFAAVGNDDPRVLKGRQNLASALF